MRSNRAIPLTFAEPHNWGTGLRPVSGERQTMSVMFHFDTVLRAAYLRSTAKFRTRDGKRKNFYGCSRWPGLSQTEIGLRSLQEHLASDYYDCVSCTGASAFAPPSPPHFRSSSKRSRTGGRLEQSSHRRRCVLSPVLMERSPLSGIEQRSERRSFPAMRRRVTAWSG